MSETLKNYFWVAIGSTVGGVGRFWISGLVADRMSGAFPWNTLVVNVTGSFLIGVLGALTAATGRLAPEVRSFGIHFLMIGVCGGYTTFSSFSLQTFRLAQDGEWLYAGGNAVASLIFCMLAVWLGFYLGRIFTPR
jgi:CrcB protein